MVAALPAALLVAAAAGVPTPAPTIDPANWDSLNELLAGMVLSAPDLNISIKNISKLAPGTILPQPPGTPPSQVNVTGLRVRALHIGDASLPSTQTDESVTVYAITDDLHARVSFGLDYWIPGMDPSHGNNFDVNVTAGFSIGVTLRRADPRAAPLNGSVDACKVALGPIDVGCAAGSDDSICPLVEMFLPSLLPGLLTQLDAKACGALRGPGLASALSSVAALWAAADAPPPPAPPPSVAEAPFVALAAALPDGLVDFEGPIDSIALKVVEQLLTATLLDRVVDAVTRGTGALTVPVGATLALGGVPLIGDALDMNVTVVDVTAYGLDRFTSLAVMKPVGHYSLDHFVQWSTLGLAATLQVSAAGGADVSGLPPVVDHIKLNLTLRDVGISATTLVALDKAKVRNLTVAELTHHLNCLVDPIVSVTDAGGTLLSGLNVTQLSVGVGSVAFTSIGSINPLGADAVIQQGIDALLKVYGAQLTRALPRLMQMTVRPLLDAGIALLVEMEQLAAPCPHDCPRPSFLLIVEYLAGASAAALAAAFLLMRRKVPTVTITVPRIGDLFVPVYLCVGAVVTAATAVAAVAVVVVWDLLEGPWASWRYSAQCVVAVVASTPVELLGWVAARAAFAHAAMLCSFAWWVRKGGDLPKPPAARWCCGETHNDRCRRLCDCRIFLPAAVLTGAAAGGGALLLLGDAATRYCGQVLLTYGLALAAQRVLFGDLCLQLKKVGLVGVAAAGAGVLLLDQYAVARDVWSIEPASGVTVPLRLFGNAGIPVEQLVTAFLGTAAYAGVLLPALIITKAWYESPSTGPRTLRDFLLFAAQMLWTGGSDMPAATEPAEKLAAPLP